MNFVNPDEIALVFQWVNSVQRLVLRNFGNPVVGNSDYWIRISGMCNSDFWSCESEWESSIYPTSYKTDFSDKNQEFFNDWFWLLGIFLFFFSIKIVRYFYVRNAIKPQSMKQYFIRICWTYQNSKIYFWKIIVTGYIWNFFFFFSRQNMGVICIINFGKNHS